MVIMVDRWHYLRIAEGEGEGGGEERQLIDLRLALPQVKTKRDQPVR